METERPRFQAVSVSDWEAGIGEPAKPLAAVFASEWSGHSERMPKRVSRQKYRGKQRWEGEGEKRRGRKRDKKMDVQRLMSFVWGPGAKLSQEN